MGEDLRGRAARKPQLELDLGRPVHADQRVAAAGARGAAAARAVRRR
jgi:hypothetical protein